MNRTSTVSDIAKIAGCAPTTVSRYLNKSGYVGENTALRIQDAIDQLGYKPNFMARSLRNRVSNTIFMAVPDMQNPFFSQMYRIVQMQATKNGYFLIAYDTAENPYEELRALDSAAELNVSGIIFFSNNFTPLLLSGLKKLDVPTVVNYYEKCEFDSVHGKKNRSSFMATQYLIDRGHTKIGFVGGSRGSLIEESRKNGYLSALTANRIPVEEAYIVETGFTLEAGKRAGNFFADMETRPTAICCANDLVALGVITCFNERGISIPGEVSITGIDNVLYGEASSPTLTTVTSDSELFAQNAFSMLLERMNGEYDGTPRDVVIEHRLVVRKSTS